jgi:hypothetical protein
VKQGKVCSKQLNKPAGILVAGEQPTGFVIASEPMEIPFETA